MSFKVAYESLNNSVFTQALQKINNMPTKDVRVAYRLKRMTDKLMSAQKKIREEYITEVLAKHVHMDEKTKLPIVEENGSFRFKEGANDAMLHDAEKEFGKKEALIDRAKLTYLDVKDFALSASDLAGLEPIIDMDTFGEA